jgi:hypothetical protein
MKDRERKRKSVTISSAEQRADTLTKALPLEKLKHFNELLYIQA